MALLTVLALTLSQYDALPPPAPPPPPSSVVVFTSSAVQDRELTIRALRGELDDLEDEKAGIGYFFPVFWSLAGTGVALFGATLPTVSNSDVFKNTVMGVGSVAAAAATTWLVFRIARAIGLGSDIDEKRAQLHALQQQRVAAR